MSILLENPTVQRYSRHNQALWNVPAPHHIGETNDLLRIPTILCDNATFGTTTTNFASVGTLAISGTTTFNSIDLNTATFAASYTQSINAEMPQLLIGTALNGAAIVNRTLDLTGGNKAVTYAAGLFAAPSTQRTFCFQYTPNYSGFPLPFQTQYMASIYEPPASLNNLIRVVHGDAFVIPAGRLTLLMFDPAGLPLYEGGPVWSVTAGVTYDIEVSYDTVNGAVRMFINGVLKFTDTIPAFATSSAIALFRTGNQGVPQNFKINNLIVLPYVLHTLSYSILTNPIRVLSANIQGALQVGNILATTIQCTSAPTLPTSVVRLSDIAPITPTSVDLTGYWGPTNANAMTQNIRLQRVGNVVTAIASRVSATGTMTAPSLLTYSVNIPAGWIIADPLNQMYDFIVIQSPAATAVRGRLTVVYNPGIPAGQIIIDKTEDWSGSLVFNGGDTVIMPSWTISWLAA